MTLPTTPTSDPSSTDSRVASSPAESESGAKKAARRPWLLVVLVPVLALVAIGSYNAVVRSRNIDYAIQARKTADQIELQKIELQSKVRSGTATVDDVDKVRAVTNRAADEVEKVDKNQAAAMRDFVDLCTDASRPLVAAFNEFQKEGGLEPKSLTEKPALEARLAKLRAIAPVADESLAKVKRLIDDTRTACSKHGLSDAQTQKFIDGIGKDRPAQLVRIRELDVAMIKEMDAYLALLNDHFDGWSFKEEQVLFKSNDLLANFQAITGRLGALASEQNALAAKTQEDSKFLSKP